MSNSKLEDILSRLPVSLIVRFDQANLSGECCFGASEFEEGRKLHRDFSTSLSRNEHDLR